MAHWQFRDASLKAKATLEACVKALAQPLKETKTRASAGARIGDRNVFVKIERQGWSGTKRLLRATLPFSWRIVHEAQRMRAAFEAGVPVPEPLALFRHEGSWYFVTSAIEGESMLQRRRAASEVMRLSQREQDDLLSALLALHRAGIEHRDLHAGNILLTPGDPSVVLLDFATAKLRKRMTLRAGLSDLRFLANSVHARSTIFSMLRFALRYLRARDVRDRSQRRRWICWMNRRFLKEFVGREDQLVFADGARASV